MFFRGLKHMDLVVYYVYSKRIPGLPTRSSDSESSLELPMWTLGLKGRAGKDFRAPRLAHLHEFFKAKANRVGWFFNWQTETCS